MMLKLFLKGHALIFSTRQLMYTQLDNATENDLIAYESGLYLIPIADLDTKFKLSICWKKNRELPTMATKLLDALIHNYNKYSDDTDYTSALPKVL